MKAAAKSYFGKSLAELTLAQDAILAAIPQSPTKFDLMRNADRGLPRGRRRRRGMHQVQARRPARLGDRPAPEQGPRPDEDAQHADRHQAHGGRVRGRQGGAGRARASRSPPSGRHPTSCGRSGAALGEMLCPDDPDRLPRGRHRRLQGHHHARPEDAEDRREVGLRRRPGAERQEPVGDPDQPQDPAARHGPGSWACAGTTSTTRPPASSTTGPARSSPTPGRPATRPRATRSSSRSSTSWPTAGASRVRRSSRSTTPSASTTRR